MKINYLIIFLYCFHANAQEKIENTLNLPVDKFKSYENCCVKRPYPFPGFGDPIKNELRIYTYENESKALVYKTGKIIKIINNKYDNSKVIIIKSEDYFYIYKNLTKLEVEENQIVLENQILGKIMTIDSENYLGFEIRNKKGEKLNPIEYLKTN